MKMICKYLEFRFDDIGQKFKKDKFEHKKSTQNRHIKIGHFEVSKNIEVMALEKSLRIWWKLTIFEMQSNMFSTIFLEIFPSEYTKVTFHY